MKLDIHLISGNERLCAIWKRHLKDYFSSDFGSKSLLSINVHVDNEYLQLLEFPPSSSAGMSCFVSPANSFGHMNGGYDLHLARLFSTNSKDFKIAESHVRSTLLKKHCGYLTTGNCELIDFFTLDSFKEKSMAWEKFQARYILTVPTMNVPQEIKFLSDLHAYQFVFDTCWEVFSKILAHNDTEKDDQICNLVIPGLGTGYGGLNLEIVGKSMIYSMMIFYNENLSHSAKSYYVMRILNFELESLFNGEVCENDNHTEQDKYYRVSLAVEKQFNIENDGFNVLFLQTQLKSTNE